MYKPYRINIFWEAVVIVFLLLSLLKFGDFIGLPLFAHFALFVVVGCLLTILFEVFIPRYRFMQAAAHLKDEPDKTPKVRGAGEVFAEILSEGPTFDSPIGRGPKKPK